MAETRARARALRDAGNVGATALEEISDANDEADAPQRATNVRSMPRRAESSTPSDEPKKARKSQVDLLRTLAVEWRGESGVERLENWIGRPLSTLTRE